MVGKGASRISTAALRLLSLLGVSEFGRICLVKEVVSGLAAQGDAASRRVGVTHRDISPEPKASREAVATGVCVSLGCDARWMKQGDAASCPVGK